MKIVLLCSAQSNQVALANKIAAEFNLVGVVVEKKKTSRKRTISSKNIAALARKILFRKTIQAWWNMLKHYAQHYQKFPAVKIIEVSNVNDEATKHFINDCKPDIVMVSGTAMVRKNILSIPLPVGMINLHTGLSPYIKGGPNCTNWCIATNQLHLIGNTIMWIDAGIDSGDIVTTGIVPFSGDENLGEIHIKVMEHAHELYLRAVRAIATNKAAKVKQDSIATGTTYYTRDWGFKANIDLLKNLKHFKKTVTSDDYTKKMNHTITINTN